MNIHFHHQHFHHSGEGTTNDHVRHEWTVRRKHRHCQHFTSPLIEINLEKVSVYSLFFLFLSRHFSEMMYKGKAGWGIERGLSTPKLVKLPNGAWLYSRALCPFYILGGSWSTYARKKHFDTIEFDIFSVYQVLIVFLFLSNHIEVSRRVLRLCIGQLDAWPSAISSSATHLQLFDLNLRTISKRRFNHNAGSLPLRSLLHPYWEPSAPSPSCL